METALYYFSLKSFIGQQYYEIKEDKPVPVVLASGLPDYRIYTDKKRLMQVITNFINNALKFTSKGRSLWSTILKRVPMK